LQSLELSIEEKDNTIKRLTEQVSKASKSTQDSRALLDELDILREKLAGAGKAEAKLAKLTKRLEATEQVAEEKRAIEEQLNTVLKEKIELEAAAGRSTGLKGEMDDWKQQVTEAEDKAAELTAQVERQNVELQASREELSAAQVEIQALKTDNLSLSNELALKDDDDDDGLGMGSPGGLDFQSSMAEKERVMRLEQENKDLQAALKAAQTGGTGNAAGDAKAAKEIEALKAKLDAQQEEATASLQRAEKKQQEVSVEAAVAKKECERLKEQLTKAVGVAGLLKTKNADFQKMLKEKDNQLMANAQAGTDELRLKPFGRSV